MRRVTVMADIPDDVFDGVVTPKKKSRTFSKLIAILLDGYLKDGYIRAFADDTLGEFRRAAVESVEEKLSEAKATLSEMSFASEAMDAMFDQGMMHTNDMFESSKAAYNDTDNNIEPEAILGIENKGSASRVRKFTVKGGINKRNTQRGNRQQVVQDSQELQEGKAASSEEVAEVREQMNRIEDYVSNMEEMFKTFMSGFMAGNVANAGNFQAAPQIAQPVVPGVKVNNTPVIKEAPADRPIVGSAPSGIKNVKSASSDVNNASGDSDYSDEDDLVMEDESSTEEANALMESLLNGNVF